MPTPHIHAISGDDGRYLCYHDCPKTAIIPGVASTFKPHVHQGVGGEHLTLCLEYSQCPSQKDQKVNNCYAADAGVIKVIAPHFHLSPGKRSQIKLCASIGGCDFKTEINQPFAMLACLQKSPLVQESLEFIPDLISLKNLNRVKERKITIHLVRHAEAEHNIRMTNNRNFNILDPALTGKGRNQSLKLGASFKKKFTHILVSPMRRTMETAFIAFGDAIKDTDIGIIAYPDLREWGNCPSSTGSALVDIRRRAEKDRMLDDLNLSLVKEGWEKVPKHNKKGHSLRADEVKAELWQLGDRARQMNKGIWHGIRVTPAEYDRDIDILIVSHGDFIGSLVGGLEKGNRFRNAEYRSYEFVTGFSLQLVETKESKERRK